MPEPRAQLSQPERRGRVQTVQAIADAHSSASAEAASDLHGLIVRIAVAAIREEHARRGALIIQKLHLLGASSEWSLRIGLETDVAQRGPGSKPQLLGDPNAATVLGRDAAEGAGERIDLQRAVLQGQAFRTV